MSGLKRKTPLKSKGRPGRKKNKPANNRGDLKKEAALAKRQRYHEVCLIVDERDHGKCQAPGCNKRGTQHHHIIFKSSLGSDDLENLVLLCAEHHTQSWQSPHQSREWRNYWLAWQRAKYPEYAAVKRPYEEPLDTEALRKELADKGEEDFCMITL